MANVSLTSTLPPTRTSGASSSWARSSTCCATRELGVLVEVAGQRDDHERGAPVGGPERVGSGRPGVGHVEHALERGDRRQAGGEVALDLGVVDVDVVGDDGDLPAGLGEVVELLGHAARLGGRAGAEVGRQHRERGAADGRGHDQQRDPREDDGAPAAHHETPEPAHHAATRSLELPTRATAGWGRRSRTAYRTPASALTARAPEAPKMACWRSASTITCDVISQPTAQSAGVATAHRTRSTRRIGIDSAWASADGGAADGAHRDQAGGVGAIADGGGTGGQADGQTGRGGADPADPPVAVDAADAGLHGAEHGTAGETADHSRAGGVDVAGRGSSRHAGQREPDEGRRATEPTS